MSGMGGGAFQQVLASSASEATYIDDLFRNAPYIGNGSSSTVIPSIDITEDGGAVFLKKRFSTGGANSGGWSAADTVRGAGKLIRLDDTDAEATFSDRLTEFTSTGFKPGNNSQTNDSSTNSRFISYTFKKKEKFFDIIKYTGTGSNQTISHNLGSVPGSIWVKNLDQTDNWAVYHRHLGAGKFLVLNTESSASTVNDRWQGTTPTDSVFYVGDAHDVNASGEEYIAYIFAHDEQSFGTDGDQALIKCGGYTGNGSSGQTISIGFEPQWLMIKQTDGGNPWTVWDVMRDWFADDQESGEGKRISLNSSSAENNYGGTIYITHDGFKCKGGDDKFNGSSYNYVYMALRAPHKPPESATEVFKPATRSGVNSNNFTDGATRVTDMVMTKRRNSGNSPIIGTRLLGQKTLDPSGTSDDDGTFWETRLFWDQRTGVEYGVYDQVNVSNGATYIDYFWTRAPGFFDVVTYGQNGSGQTLNHQLTVAPEMIWVKNRDASDTWQVYHSALGTTSWLYLNEDSAASTSNNPGFANIGATTFDIGNYGSVNGTKNVAYLFASLAGISKVGSYTGDGTNNRTIDCGFTAGARWFFIKRTDLSAGWFVYDTARGVSSGDDPYWRLESADAEVTDADYVEPANAGFAVNNHADFNASGGNYIFYAIA